MTAAISSKPTPPSRAVALRTVPLGAAILEGESIDSWIEALGRRHGVSTRQMLTVLGMAPPPDYTQRLVYGIAPDRLRRIEQAAGLPPGRLDAAVGDQISVVSPLGSRGSRFCPPCLAESHGRWPLAWRLNWTIACPRHRVLIHDVCPSCHTPARRTLTGGNAPLPAASCARAVRYKRQRCGADLTTAPCVPVGAEILEVQHWIDQLLTDLRATASHTPTQPATDHPARAFTDLPILVSWLVRHQHQELHTAAANIHPNPHALIEHPGHSTSYNPNLYRRLDSALTAVVLARLKTMLGPNDTGAITALRQHRAAGASPHRTAPPGLPTPRWNSLVGVFPNRYLRAIDEELTSTERLRMKTPTPAAERPRDHDRKPRQRVRMIPQTLWPDWSARLLPVAGIAPHQLRAVISVCLLIPGQPTRDSTSLAASLGARINPTAISAVFHAFATLPEGSSLTAVLTLLCRIATHLDEVGSPIDYQRRREQIPAETISWQDWHDLACSARAHPGDRACTGRHLHAQRHLHQLLCGTDLDNPRHPLSFRTPGERSGHLEFVASMTPRLRRALREHATSLLVSLGINEPLSWSPPAELAEGLALPGIDTDTLDMSTIRRLVVDQQRPLGEVAARLGVHLEHIRIAIERLDRPERRWSKSAAPTVWRRNQQATRLLTRDFFEREYVQRGQRLADIAETTGFGRHIIARHAKKAGITLATSPAPIPIDQDWLRQQYCHKRRSITDIAAELGVTGSTVERAMRRARIPSRPQGVHSFPDMLTTLDPNIPRDIRAAVEGGLQGWQRLRRFQIAMLFPSLDTAATYLQTHGNTLVKQFQRLEHDIGEPLFHRSAFDKPQQPTTRGQKLLSDLTHEHIQNLMKTEHGQRPYPQIPNDADLAQATAQFANRRPPGPLIPFDDIDIQRIRITRPTLTLLRDLTDHAEEPAYGHGILARTEIDPGTLYPLLKRLERAGWLTSWPEDEESWLAGAPPGRGPRRRRTYYALTPQGRQAALHELAHHTTQARRKRKTDDTPPAQNP